MKSNGIITDQDHIKLHHGDHDGTSSDLLPAGMSSIRIPVHGTGTWYQVPSTRYVSGVAGTGTWYHLPVALRSAVYLQVAVMLLKLMT